MKLITFLLLCIFLSKIVFAQQPYNHNKMVFAATNKPNTIIYNDTIYKGSTQFKTLFLRTGDADLAKLFQQHQNNKVAGGIISGIGTVATFIGISEATRTGGNNTVGWLVTGGGLVATITGGYLVLVGQQKIMTATELFNKRYATKATAGIGITNNGAGLVVKF